MDKKLKKLRKDAETIFMAGVDAVEPMRAVHSHLTLEDGVLVAGGQSIPLEPDGKVFIVGAGKAGAPMAAAVENILQNRVSQGTVVVKYGHTQPVQTVRLLEAGHPVPDENGLTASREIIDILEGASRKDLVICLISGGGSSLLPLPAPPVTLEDKSRITELLLESGAEIGEINAVRKHLSLTKGGGLVKSAYPARMLTLILSDVVGDDLDIIASGPTVADSSTFADALEVLGRYGLTKSAPDAVLKRLQRGADGDYPETLKSNAEELHKTINVLVGTNAMALQAAVDRARDLGYNATVLSAAMTGETREAAEVHASLAREMFGEEAPSAAPACLLSGGETTVTIRGQGKGGRNQEFALAAALGIEGLPGAVILSGGTDGTDGPTDAAGAVVDGTTVARARNAGLDPLEYLDNNDSYTFFEALGDLLITGPTLTNVMDLRVVLVDKPSD